MPTTSLKPSMMGLTMRQQYPPSYRPDSVMISWMSQQAVGDDMTNVVSITALSALTYPAANRALGYPFCLAEPYLVQKVWWVNGTTATTDNADVAVYTEDGATKLVAAGSTLIATANVVQEVDVTDTLLLPGRYWCVYNQNGTTATPIGTSSGVAQNYRHAGVAQFAGAVPLGSTFTPAGIASAALPLFGIAARTQVA